MEKKLSDYIVQIKNVIPEDKHDQFLKLLDKLSVVLFLLLEKIK